MKLDNKLLKEMIAEALEEASKDMRDHGSRDAAKTKPPPDETEQGNPPPKKGVSVSGGKEYELTHAGPSGLEETVSEEEIQSAKEKEEKETAEAAAAAEELASLEADKAKQALGESFQLTKGRLRQIIREELISAKKQGLL